MTGVALLDRRTASPEAVRRWPALLVGASATLFVVVYGTLVVWNYHPRLASDEFEIRFEEGPVILLSRH